MNNETLTEAGEVTGLTMLLVMLGSFLKAIPNFPDKWIPTALSLVGCAVSLIIGGVTIPSAIQGFAAGLTAVGANQLYRQHTANDNTTPQAPVQKPADAKPPTP